MSTTPIVERPQSPAERILRSVWDRLNTANEHFVGVVIGREGVGKSHTAMTIAAAIDDGFSPDSVLFGPEELLERLRDGQYSPGDMFVVDEAGVSFGSRTWQDRAQVRANQALQLIRSHNIGVLFTLPRLGELDSQTQGRLQALVEIVDKRPEQYVTAKWKWVKPKRRDEGGGIKTPFPKIGDKKIRSIRLGPPPAELVEPYETQKQAFQQEVYAAAVDELSDEPAEDDDEPQSAAEIAEQIDVLEFTREINGGAQVVLDRRRIAAEFNIGAPKSKRVKRLLLDEHADELPDNVV